MSTVTGRFPGAQHVSPKIINGKHINCRHRPSQGNPEQYKHTNLHSNYSG